ncbi:hypothetical protein GO730_18955 [Spirosoma sp. HMF3257]|uniref:Uncharacterized protein n=1 Tax=Spirosoma telluris TaxID=2183553 RepID=A0A327NKK2_9BACT|nr:hypothetical protein [Spirosoma telluris]RAI75702.1 hypothetical protein HMF3257_18885 [Spirosoma telluris]
MKTNETTVGLVAGHVTETTKSICRSLAEKGISAIVVQKESRISEPDEAVETWSGQPGKDLFFNGWKLLF